MNTFICYDRCSTCKKAEKWLVENGIEFNKRAIKEEHPNEAEIKKFYEMSNEPLKKLFNTSGQLYKSMALKDKLSSMSEEEQIELLASDGMLVKRPLMVTEDKVLIGFKEEEWRKILLA